MGDIVGFEAIQRWVITCGLRLIRNGLRRLDLP